MRQSLNMQFDSVLEQTIANVVLLLNLALLLSHCLKQPQVLIFTLKVQNLTLLKFNVSLLLLTSLRAQTYLYVVIACYMDHASLDLLLFRFLSTSCSLCYDLCLGFIAITWISILCKVFLQTRRKGLTRALTGGVLCLFTCALISLILVTYDHGQETFERIFTICYFTDCLASLSLFTFGCVQFLRHLAITPQIRQEYKKIISGQIIILIFGQLIRIAYLTLKIFDPDMLKQIKYQGGQESDSLVWALLSIALILLGDLVPTFLLMRVFYPSYIGQNRHQQSTLTLDMLSDGKQGD